MRARAGAAPALLARLGVVAVSLVLGLSVPSGAGATGRPPPLGTIALPAVGFGYAVTAQGPLDASRLPAGSPNASAAARALRALGGTTGTYQRTWRDATGVNQVQDLVVRFPTDAGARAFVDAARRALAGGEIVSSGPFGSIPGAQRVTYFGSTDQAGVGQTVTMRVGNYAAVLSFLSGASGNPAPITQAAAARVAKAQYAAVAGVVGMGRGKARGRGVSAADVGWALLAVGVLAAAVATPLVLRRRRPHPG